MVGMHGSHLIAGPEELLKLGKRVGKMLGLGCFDVVDEAPSFSTLTIECGSVPRLMQVLRVQQE